MDKEYICTRMEIGMMASLSTTLEKDKELCISLMEISIKEVGNKMHKMAMESTNGRMETSIKVFLGMA